jgi:sulfatase maturation enzyme AslB (radical SAM superfamily)
MELKTLLSLKKKGKWIHYNLINYNLINQTMIRTSLSPTDLDKSPSEIKEELLYGTDKEMLIESHRTYYQNIKKEMMKKRELNSPFLSKSEVIITLWYDCNFACPYCYQQHKYYDDAKESDKINIEKTIEFFKNKSKNGEFPPKTVVFIGGEPLLKGKKYSDSVLTLLGFINKSFPGIEIHIISNGYHLGEYVDSLFQFKDLNFVLTITLGSTRKRHKFERNLRNRNSVDTFEKIFEGLKKFKKKIPKSYINIRMNFGKDYREVDDTKDMMYLIKKEMPDIRFELSPVVSFSNHQEISLGFFKLLKDLLIYEDFSKSIVLKLNENLYFLIRNSIPKLERKEISSKQNICNAVYFTTNYDLFSDFQIQPCEDFRHYRNINSSYLKISKSFLKSLDKRVEQCIDCPFFVGCISNPCKIIKRQTIDKKACYEKELLPLFQIIKEFY